MHCKPNGAFHGNSSETNSLWISFIFIGPKSNHCFALSLICYNCYIDLYLCLYFSPFAKQNQAEVWPRFQSLLKLLIWTKDVECVKVLDSLGPSCLWQWLRDHSLSKSANCKIWKSSQNGLLHRCSVLLWEVLDQSISDTHLISVFGQQPVLKQYIIIGKVSH